MYKRQVDGKLGSVYFTIDGRRYEVPGIQKIEAHDSVKERSMRTVGTVKTQTAVAGVEAVSYTHLDVYKRQVPDRLPTLGE